MPSRSFPEFILTLAAGRPRAAAIYGDLTEMAATRGRLWLFSAYLRTLASLTWRIVLALFVAEVARELMFNLVNLYFRATPPAWRIAGGPFLLNSAGPLLACVMSTLWLALPFAAVRYGVRDRFVQLTFVVVLGTTVAFLFIPVASVLCAAATVAIGCAALFSQSWRRPAIALAAIGISGFATLAAALWIVPAVVLYLRERLPHPPLAYPAPMPMIAFQATLLIIAIACSVLHRRLLELPPGSSSAAA